MVKKSTDKELTITSTDILQTTDSEYVRLVSLISDVWENARGNASLAVNTELLHANWQTGRYIVEFEQHGNIKAEYGKQLLTNLSKDLTRLKGKGYSRSNLFNMRLFYVRFPKIQTLSGQLTWSHYLELLKCEDPQEMQFYMKECVNQGWKVRELKRQINSSLFLLGARKDELLMEYALQGIDNQLFAARYQLYLPNREELQSQLDRLLANSYRGEKNTENAVLQRKPV